MSQEPLFQPEGPCTPGRKALVVCSHLRPGRDKRRSSYMMQPIAGLHVDRSSIRRFSMSTFTTKIGTDRSILQIAPGTISSSCRDCRSILTVCASSRSISGAVAPLWLQEEAYAPPFPEFASQFFNSFVPEGSIVFRPWLPTS